MYLLHCLEEEDRPWQQTGYSTSPALTAIDVHVHVESDGHGHCALDDELLDASAAYFRSSENRTPTVADIADALPGPPIAAVVFTVDADGATGPPGAVAASRSPTRPPRTPTS